MTVSCYCNSTPETVPVTINNTTVNVALDDDTLDWLDETFEPTDADDSPTTTKQFTLVDGTIVDPDQVLVFIDNVPQPGTAYSINEARTVVTLDENLEAGQTLRVHYLGVPAA